MVGTINKKLKSSALRRRRVSRYKTAVKCYEPRSSGRAVEERAADQGPLDSHTSPSVCLLYSLHCVPRNKGPAINYGEEGGYKMTPPPSRQDNTLSSPFSMDKRLSSPSNFCWGKTSPPPYRFVPPPPTPSN